MKEQDETATILEKIREKTPTKSPFLRLPEPKEYTRQVVENVLCPACNEPLEKAVIINGDLRGWCGNKKMFVRIKLQEVIYVSRKQG